MVINTNTAATNAAYNLGKNYADHERNLTRLSTGLRINSSYDDAAGLAVSMKMAAAIRRSQAVEKNVANANSFLETQDGALAIATKVVTRMSELAALALDVTKNDKDLQNYNTEFRHLRSEIENIAREKFNGISLFATTDIYQTYVDEDFENKHLNVITSEDGEQSCQITQPHLNTNIGGISQLLYTFYDDSDGYYTYPGDSIHEDPIWPNENGRNGYSAFGYDVLIEGDTMLDLDRANAGRLGGYAQLALQELAIMRAQNGAEQSRLHFALDTLAANQTNLESALSRIQDVDIAQTTSDLAKTRVLIDAGTAMSAQANSSQQSILKLLDSTRN